MSSTKAVRMRICIASKFPPIEGGIASRTYWQVRELLEQGHEVTVVTNAECVESEYRIDGCTAHLAELSARWPLRIVNVSTDPPWHIPSSPDYLTRLSSLLIDVLGEEAFDVIESGFLLPYGIAAHMAAQARGVPHVLRHGASDLTKFLVHPEYRPLLEIVIRGADSVVTDERHAPIFRDLGVACDVEPVYCVRANAFQRAERPGSGDRRVYGAVGKINYHWRRKGLDEVVDWFARQDRSQVDLRVVGQGIGASDFVAWATARLGHDLVVHPFVPPWEMPSLLSEMDAVFCLSVDDPIAADSMLRLECEAMGVEVIDTLPR